MKIVENRKYYFVISGAIILLGIIVMLVNYSRGKGFFDYDVEFSGGTSFTVDIGGEFNNDDISKIVADVTGQASPQVQKVLGFDQVMIKVKTLDQQTRMELMDEIATKYSLDKDKDFSYSDVSPTISNEMQQTAILAVAVACVAMLIYISIRFKDLKMGASAILALLHDALCMLVVYAVLRIPLNTSFIAAILTIIGYSINATIIIFDRIRENKVIMKRAELPKLINTSVTQTLRRSLFTSITTLLSVLCLYILGVSSIKEFTLPIIAGLIFGTYSSVFLSGSIWYSFNTDLKKS